METYKTFKLVGRGSVLKLHLEHPIHLDADVKYFIALDGFYVKNSKLNNFENHVYAVQYTNWHGKHGGDSKLDVVFPPNKYTLQDIENKLKETYTSLLDPSEKGEYYVRFNDKTNRVEMKLPFTMGLFPKYGRNYENLGYYLGYAPLEDTYYEKDKQYTALYPPRLSPYNIMEIHCNLVSPTLINHKNKSHLHEEAQILHSFFPKPIKNNFDDTLCITEAPVQKCFVPLSSHVRTINHIRLDIRNEQDNLLNFTDGTIICYLTLTRNGPKNP